MELTEKHGGDANNNSKQRQASLGSSATMLSRPKTGSPRGRERYRTANDDGKTTGSILYSPSMFLQRQCIFIGLVSECPQANGACNWPIQRSAFHH